MTETLELILTKFTPEVITISVMALVFVLALVIFYLLYNRKKFHQLKHQIPASVVKNYLDSIIQNSMSLKSSLFRGGGLDIGEGIPSVMPVANLVGGQASLSGVSQEEVNQKNAEIARLRSEVSLKQQTIIDLENQLKVLQSAGDPNESKKEIQKLQTEVGDLKKKLETAQEALKNAESSGGDKANPEVEKNLQTVTKERDELKERLMEYEIIEEDLANLKRLQQENAQLKKSLEALKGGGEVAEEVVEEPAKEVVKEAEAPVIEETMETVEEEVAPVESEIEEETISEESPIVEEPVDSSQVVEEEEAPVQAKKEEEEVPIAMEEDQKSAEELLSEFEKMLG